VNYLRNEAAAQKVVRDIQEEGGRALALRVDGGMFIVQDPWRTREFAYKNRSPT